MTGLATVDPEQSQLGRAVRDLKDGLADWRLWGFLGWHDIRQRYRRSTLGPLWLTLSMVVTVISIGLIWGTLFGLDAKEFVPYLCVGMVVWNLIVGIVTEGCQAFIGAGGYITQTNRPVSTYAFWVIWRNLLISFHTSLVYIGIVPVLGIWPNQHTLMALPGLLLLVLAITWPAFLFGIIAARFRDIPQIVQSILTVAFFVTPVIWKAEQLGPRAYIAQWNPLTHIMDLVRAPLLGQPLTPLAWEMAGATALVGWLVTFALFVRYRGRIAYWL